MKIILLKSAKIAGKLKFPSDSETYEMDEEIAKVLIEKGIAKDANEKETIIVKDEALSLEIETLKEDNELKVLEIETLKELLKVSIDTAKGTVPDGAEVYLNDDKLDLTK